MTRRKTPNQPTRSHAKRSPGSFRAYSLIVVCGLVLASGFFLAAQQHFSSMDYGMKNSKLRRQIDELQAEKQRLILAREVSLTPNEIKKAAKKVGLFNPMTATAPAPELASFTKEKPAEKKAPASNPLIIKTASVTAAQPRVSPAVVRVETQERPEKQIKRALAAE